MIYKNFKYIALAVALILFAISIPGLAQEKKFRVRHVTFENNEVFRDRALHRVMLNRPSTLFLPVNYSEALLAEDINQLELYYHQMGYLQARILSQIVKLDSAKHKADIMLVVDEGNLTTVEGISIFGNEIFADSVLIEQFKLKSGDALVKSKVEQGILKIINLYADEGYVEAKVNSEINVNAEVNRATVDIVVEENKQFKIGDVFIHGLDKTRQYVVTREFLFEPGQIINYSKLLKSQRELYLTGLFKSVYLKPVASDIEGYKNIEIELKELDFREFSFRFGYGSYEKVRGKVGFSNINIQGTARKFSTSVKLSYVNQMIETSVTAPWTFGTRWKTDASVFSENSIEPGYHLSRQGGKISTGKVLFNDINTIIFFRLENARLTDVETTEILDEINPRLRSIGNTVVRDTRNNLFNATKGSYFEASCEYAGLFFSGTNTFTRVTGRYNRYLTLSKNIVLASSLDVGWMTAGVGGLSNIPLNERFYTGGPNSIRGLDYRMAGNLDVSGNPVGGRFKTVANLLELRFGIFKMFGGALFVDAGNVYYCVTDFNIQSLRVTPGVGIRVNTPIGMGRLDYGFNPDKREGESSGVLYFSIGQAF